MACSERNHCKTESQTHCRSFHRWRGDRRTRMSRGEAAVPVAWAAAGWAEVVSPCSARSRCRWAHPISSDRTKRVQVNACKPLHTPVDTMEVEAWAAVAAVVAMEVEPPAAAALAATLVDCSAVAGGRRAGKAAETGCTRRSHGTCHSSMRTSWW